MRRLAVGLVLLVLRVGVARADDGVVGSGVLVEARAHYDRGRQLFDSEDFEAAALEFDQAQAQYATAEATDADARTRRRMALSNEATCYARARMPVEASDAFRLLRATFGAELPADELAVVDAALEKLEDEIGTATVSGLPHDAHAVVRIDGRLWQLPEGAPVRLAAREHDLEVVVPRFRPFAARVVVRPRQDTAVTVSLVSSDEPARLRVETPIAVAEVTIDDAPPARAPVERIVSPGKHRYRVTAKNHLATDGEIEVAPGERVVLRAALVPARAPIGFRAEFFGLGVAPLDADAPFDATTGLGVRLFWDVEWLGTLRIGAQAERIDHPLNGGGAGVVTEWCPVTWSAARNEYAFCPANLALIFRLPAETEAYRGTFGTPRFWTALEARRNLAFVRGAIGIAPQSLEGKFPVDDASWWELSFEVAMGFEL